jgi:predicted RNA-binding protein with PUA-like domain
VFVYHTGKEKQVVGMAKVVASAYVVHKDSRPLWSCVVLTPIGKVNRPLTLKEVKADPAMADCLLVRTSRLSVMPLEADHVTRLLELAETKMPTGLVT